MCVAQRRNEQQKPRSIYNWAHPVARFDRFLEGRPSEEASTSDYTAFLGSLRGQVAPRTLRGVSTHLTVLWRDLNDRDDLRRSVRKALSVKVPRDAPAGELVQEHEFEALLQEASRLTGESQDVPTSLMWTTILWILWDSGVRASEATHLKVGDVEFTGETTGRLHLRADGRPLKTGARVVPIADAVPSLRALLSVHPHEQGEESPLLLGRRRRSDTGRMRYLSLNRGLNRLATKSGVNGIRPWTADVTPHDFRHTCATRKARLGWGAIC